MYEAENILGNNQSEQFQLTPLENKQSSSNKKTNKQAEKLNLKY